MGVTFYEKEFDGFIGIIVLIVAALTACTTNSDKQESKETDGQKNTNGATQSSDNGDEKKEDKSEDDIFSGDFTDQTDLKIGDTGQTESTLGKYKVTVNSVKMLDELDGESSTLDHFFVTEITVENIGDKSYDVKDIIDNLEFAKSLEGVGAGGLSKFYDSIKAFEGTIEPGDTITGETVFQGQDSETYYIRTKDGLISAGAVKN
ncbi:DUF4352 domain-containing protein [Bacillus sp. FSL K6-3431]|uniref:DUF4352 domain-containing protein n=1 Tax=Bacillus sp. FSL K6-3431 TaxID=2921500 RepID=UPI0030F701F9